MSEFNAKATGQRVKSWCVDAGVTQEQAAERLGMTYAKFLWRLSAATLRGT